MRKIIIGLFLVGLIGITAVIINYRAGTSPRFSAKQTPNITAREYPIKPIQSYRYSVVPGGVGSVEELRGALTDWEIAVLCPGFDFAHAHVEPLPEDRMAYVSLRKNGKLGWTERPVFLKKGELVITDGNCIVRTRCANFVSTPPRVPTLLSNLLELEIVDDAPILPTIARQFDAPSVSVQPPPDPPSAKPPTHLPLPLPPTALPPRKHQSRSRWGRLGVGHRNRGNCFCRKLSKKKELTTSKITYRMESYEEIDCIPDLRRHFVFCCSSC